MKERLDVILTTQGLAESREKAKRLIMAGQVFVNSQREDKPGSTFETEGLKLEVKGNELPYVSRGGLKLERALKIWPIGLKDAVCLDIGSSTGGFTDCMLQNGAAKVYAIDSGTNQLAWKLRSDERVVCMEKTNFRYVTDKDIPEQADFAGADVSFISLSKILPQAYPLLKEGGSMVCLIKPQFEAGREYVGKKGVVRDKKVHIRVIAEVCGYATECGFNIAGLDHSPIKGPEGNIEYLLYLKKNTGESITPDIASAVNEAHESL